MPLMNLSLTKRYNLPRCGLINILKNTVRSAQILMIKVSGKNISSDGRHKSGTFHNWLKLRSKYQIAILQPVVKRLLADSVPDKKQGFFLSVINGNRKHSIQLLNTGNSPFQVCCQDHLRIAGGYERVICKLILKFPEIVDFSVKDKGYSPIPGIHGLMSQRGKIQNGKPPLCKPYRIV